MNFQPTRITAALAVAGVCLLGTMSAHAADKASDAARSPMAAQPERMDSSDRANMKGWSNEKEALQAELKPGQNKAAYVKALNDRGYTLTSINTDKSDVVEYEVVKGKQSYEVKIDFDKAGMGSKVDVSTNAWRTDATKAAMSGKAVPAATRVEAGNEAYSDRARMKAWTGEKDKIEKSLALGRDKAYYDDQLRKLGYQVTSVNDAEKDYVEYEIVKGRDSFEVQIDFAANKAKKVDVTTNVWQSEATERALAGAKR